MLLEGRAVSASRGSVDEYLAYMDDPKRRSRGSRSALAHRVRSAMAHRVRVRLRRRGADDVEGLIVAMPHAGAPSYALSVTMDSGRTVPFDSVRDVERID
jgi:hypothetical protein